MNIFSIVVILGKPICITIIVLQITIINYNIINTL